MRNAKDLIWPANQNVSYFDYVKEDWLAIIGYVIQTLGQSLGGDIQHEDPLDPKACIGGGFCLDIWESSPSFGHLRIRWRGVVGASILEAPQRDNPPELHICSSLFLYSDSKKLITKDGKAYVELELIQDDKGEGQWKSLGWLEDPYGEFKSFDRYITGS